MNYTEVKKELKREFESFLNPIGYKSKSSNEGCRFILEKKENQIRLGYGIANYIDEFKTGCNLRISILSIQRVQEKIFNEAGTYDTLVFSISDYFNVVNYNFHIKTKEDIKEWMKIVKRFYSEYAVPFFEKYNSVDTIDKLLNEYPTKRIIYCDDLAWRIIIGLIAARLNDNPRYHEIKAYYSNEVETKFQGYFMYPKCRKVIEFLENHTREELIRIAQLPM